MVYLAFQADSIKLVTEFGYLNIKWIRALALMDIIISLNLVVVLLYWGFKTWVNSPFLIKKESLIFLIGILFIGPIYLIFYILYYLNILFVTIGDLLMGLGTLIFCFVIGREPKLLYILPFTIHRIVVKDRNGNPLYDHDWSQSNINETIFTGFLNAVQLMSEDVMQIGGLFDINLEDGILILRESAQITVGLVSSKSSKLLKDSVVKFTADFEKKFERELKKSIKDMTQYEGAYELIEKYFSNFPYKTIKSKKQPIFLTERYTKIPLELENKLRTIFNDEEEYEAIKAELIKSPLSFISEFIRLHDQLKDEVKGISSEDIKYLNEN